jgi:hypothetical protein
VKAKKKSLSMDVRGGCRSAIIASWNATLVLETDSRTIRNIWILPKPKWEMLFMLNYISLRA